MAPILGRKVFALANALTEPVKPGDEIYTIEHSKESFRDKKQYEARLQLYGKQIWTCKSTGSTKLTHKEAWDQEQKISKLLQKKFQSWFEKPVLELIHHNTHALEQLVDEVYREIMTKYVVDEECKFEDENGKCMRVKIVQVYTLEKANKESPEKKGESACDISSSDKVKTNHIVPDHKKKTPKEEESGHIESQREQVLHYPQKHLSLKKEDTKLAPTKFLPPKYDVKLQNEDSIISSVPVKSLHRLKRPPNKEIVRYFIRHYALRIGIGKNARWVVEDELLKKHSLSSKFANPLQDPDKCITLNSQQGTKTKTCKTFVSSEKQLSSTIKGNKDEEKNIEVKKLKKASLMTPLSSTPWHHKQVNETATTTELKSTNQDSSNSSSSELQDVKSVGSPYKSNSFKIPKKCIVPEVLPSKKKMKAQERKDSNGKMFEKQKTPKKDWKNAETKKTTTLDMSNCSPLVFGPSTSTAVPLQTYRKIQTDASSIIFHLIAFYRDNKSRKDRKADLSSLITKAARLLTSDDRALLPEDLRVLVVKRHEKIEHKQKLASMIEDQDKEELREKHNESNEKMREKAKPLTEKEVEESVEQQQYYKDQDLSGKSLPTFKLVYTPQELPNMLFGDVVKVVEFLNCYSQLLMPDEKYSINSATMMEALSVGSGGFLYLNRMLMTLLHILLQDKIANYYAEFGMKVSEIPLTLYSVSELVRLCLLNSEAEEGNEDSSQGFYAEDIKDSASLDNNGMENDFLQKLETSEYFDLTVETKLTIMVVLCHRILSTHSMDLNAQDMISPLKRQRFLLMQASTEEEKDRQLKEKWEMEVDEKLVQKHRAKFEKALYDSIAKAKLVLGRSSIGTDQNHNRYWLFSDNVPGLFIEKGWIHESINYTFSLSPKELKSGECNEDPKNTMENDDVADTEVTAVSSVAKTTTTLKQGNNLWFICDTQNKLDELLDFLHSQGVTESKLKECLHKRYRDIVHSIDLAHKPKPIVQHCDGQQELLTHLRTDVIQVAKRLYKAKLGYLDETATFEARVNTLDNLNDLGDCLITLQASVGKRFLQGFMSQKQKSQSEDPIVKTPKVNGTKRMTEEANVSSDVEKWKGAIRSAKTFSRMQVLLEMLKVCIKWGMSTANARCKVCSRKGENDQIILCDKCNKAFHLSCLRPAIYEVPDGEWLCPPCQPSTARRTFRGKNYNKDSAKEEGEGDEELSEDHNDRKDYEIEEDKNKEDDFPYLIERQLGSMKAVKAQRIRASNAGCNYQPPIKKSKIAADKGFLQFTPPVHRSYVNEIVYQNKRKQPQNPQLQKCQDILNKLTEYQYSWPFRDPLIFEQTEDYMGINIHRMDFVTMLIKFTCNTYNTVHEFLEDIKLVFYNVELYSHKRKHLNICIDNTENYLLAMLRKHLPGYTYQRIKLGKRPATKQSKRPAEHIAPLDEESAVDYCIAKKMKR